MAFTVDLESPSSTYELGPDGGLALRPQSWSDRAVGGPDRAVVRVEGAAELMRDVFRWLAWRTTIHNEEGEAVWWGEVVRVSVVWGALLVDLSLEEMANRVAVIYTTTNGAGQSVRGTTDWAEDEASIARYGTKELLVSGGEMGEAEAELMRDLTLDVRKYAVADVQVAQQGQAGATVYCRGYWALLGWRYWANGAGLEANQAARSGAVAMGVAHTASTIEFDPVDDIEDSGAGLGFIDVGDKVRVSGSTSNDGLYVIDGAGDDHVTTVETSIVTEGAGASVTLYKAGVRVGQSFQNQSGGAWTAAAISLRLTKVGSPSDNVVVELCSDSSGDPGSVLDSATLSGAALSAAATWVEFVLANTQSLAVSTTYWIVIRRDGANSTVDYYEVDVNEDGLYSGGEIKLYDGSGWVTRTGGGDVLFAVRGAEATTTQVASIIDGVGEELTGADVVEASGIERWQYADGDSLALSMAEDLLRSGTSGGDRLLVRVEADRRARVYAQAAETEMDLAMGFDGKIRPAMGGQLARGRTVAGRWLSVDEVLSLEEVGRVSPMFIESSEFDAATERLTFVAEAGRDVWEIGRVREG